MLKQQAILYVVITIIGHKDKLTYNKLKPYDLAVDYNLFVNLN